MIDPRQKLPITRPAKKRGISRGSTYYLPRATSVADLALMHRIDELHLDYPFAGSRILQWLLRAADHTASRLHIATLMRKMGIEALYRRPNTSMAEPEHKLCPYRRNTHKIPGFKRTETDAQGRVWAYKH